jgi:hypothetical protein
MLCALSAVGGLDSLRAWLRAELFLTNFRPVPLAEHAMFRGKVYEKISPQVSGQGTGKAAAATSSQRRWFNRLHCLPFDLSCSSCGLKASAVLPGCV